MVDYVNYLMIGALLYALAILNYIVFMSPDKAYQRLKKELSDCYSLLEQEREMWQEKLRIATAGNRTALELYNALNKGVITVKCPEHEKEVTVLADGTIVCPSGHRLWPEVNENE